MVGSEDIVMRRRHITPLCVAILLGAISLAACGGSDSSSSVAQSAPPATVSLAYVAPEAGFAPQELLTAQPNFCTSYGVRVNATIVGPSLITNAVIAGQLDMASASGGQFAVGVAHDPAAIVAVAGTGPLDYVVWGSPHTTSISQLQGKTLGATSIGSGGQLIQDYLLPKLGVTAFKTAYASSASVFYEEVANGTVGAITAPIPLPSSITQRGVHILEYAYKDSNAAALSFIPYFVNAKYLAGHKAEVKDVLTCLAAADRYVLQHPQTAVNIIQKAGAVTASQALAGYNASKVSFQIFPYTASDLAKMIAAFQAAHIGSEVPGVNPASAVNTTIVATVQGAASQPQL
jgi:ABC-type nitrate/sulfonate/bicarbonate transport system substrate-binding protein